MGKGRDFRIKCQSSHCGKVIYLSDGKPLSKKDKVVCPHCGYQNRVVVKKNGKIKIG